MKAEIQESQHYCYLLLLGTVNHRGVAVRLMLPTGATNEIVQSLYQSAGWEIDNQFMVYHDLLSV